MQDTPNNSETIPFAELFGPPEPAQEAALPTFENASQVGRRRKYEERGIYGDMSVCEVVRFRALTGRHIAGLSLDMQKEYDYWYFRPPNRRKDGEDYERHKRAWSRRERWLADLHE